MRGYRWFLFILLVLLPTAGQTGEDSWAKQWVQLGTVENTSKHLGHCQLNSPLDEQNYKYMCEIVKHSSLCASEVKNPQEALDCESINENTLAPLSVSSAASCMKGLFSAAVKLLTYLTDLIAGVLGYSFSETKRDAMNEALGEYYESFKNYVFLEYAKQLDATGSESLAVTQLAGHVVNQIFIALKNKINDENAALGCYNPQARQKKVCEIAGQFLIPPTVALGIFLKGSTMLRMARNFRTSIKFSRVKNLGNVGKVSELIPENYSTNSFLTVAWNPKTKEMFYAPSTGAKLADGTDALNMVRNNGGHASLVARTGDNRAKYLGGGIIIKEDRLIVATKSIGLNGFWRGFFRDGKMSPKMGREMAQEIANRTGRVTQLKDTDILFYPQ